MGEGFRGERAAEYAQGERLSRERETNPEKVNEIFQEIDKLVAKLSEQVGDLSLSAKQNYRSQLQAYLNLLGCINYEELLAVRLQYQITTTKDLPKPSDYPNKDEFAQKVATVSREELSLDTPPMSRNPDAVGVSQFGQCKWSEIQGRGSVPITDYLYELGKLMSHKQAYDIVFPPEDVISVNSLWKVQNGRHRSFALRALGSDFVMNRNLGDWVKVVRE